MAVSYTTTYNLTKPEVGASEDQWGDLLNTNFDNLDDLLDGTTPITGIDINSGNIGGVTIDGNLSFSDNTKAIFGAGSDLQIYHDGSNSYIFEQGTGELIIQTNGTTIDLRATGAEYMARFYQNAQVELYYDNAQKLATTSTGIDVTGTVTADGLTVDGNANVDGALTFTNQGVVNAYVNSEEGFYFNIDSNNDQTTERVIQFGANAADSSGKKIALFQEGGDISFYEDTGTTAKFFWDASAESLGIGTSSPSQGIHLKTASGNSYVKAERTTSSQGEVGFNTDNWYMYQKTGGSDLHFYNTADRMTIDSSGNVGIGTSSPAQKLHLNGAAENVHLMLTNSTTGSTTNDGLHLITETGTGNAYIIQRENANLIMHTNNTERMRIDSSGNLLVGKTNSTLAGAGISLLSTGRGRFTFDNFEVLELNRLTSDGDIIKFFKDGTTVGSIGTAFGYIWAGTGDVGLSFRDTLDAVLPFTPSGNTNRDAAIDLGYSSTRFKDLYLSGTANAANFNTTSDATLKTNVETLTGSLDAVKALRGVSYDWIDSGNSEVGVIAQEVEAVVPDVVSTNDQGIKSVKYGNLVGVLIEAIKEQQQRIEALEAKLGD